MTTPLDLITRAMKDIGVLAEGKLPTADKVVAAYRAAQEAAANLLLAPSNL